MSTSVDMECNNFEDIVGYHKVSGKDFGKEFGKKYDKDLSSKKVKKLKNMLHNEMKKCYWLMVTIIVS